MRRYCVVLFFFCFFLTIYLLQQNIERGYYREHLSESIMNLDQWLNIEPFKDISILARVAILLNGAEMFVIF